MILQIIGVAGCILFLGWLIFWAFPQLFDYLFEVYWSGWRKWQKYRQQKERRKQFDRANKYRKSIK